MDKANQQIRAYLKRNANLIEMDDIQDWYMRAESQRLGGGEGFSDDKKFIETDSLIMNINTVSKDASSDDFMHKLLRGRFYL